MLASRGNNYGGLGAIYWQRTGARLIAKGNTETSRPGADFGAEGLILARKRSEPAPAFSEGTVTVVTYPGVIMTPGRLWAVYSQKREGRGPAGSWERTSVPR